MDENFKHFALEDPKEWVDGFLILAEMQRKEREENDVRRTS